MLSIWIFLHCIIKVKYDFQDVHLDEELNVDLGSTFLLRGASPPLSRTDSDQNRSLSIQVRCLEPGNPAYLSQRTINIFFLFPQHVKECFFVIILFWFGFFAIRFLFSTLTIFILSLIGWWPYPFTGKTRMTKLTWQSIYCTS